MTESIFSRLRRVVSGGVDSAVSAAERASSGPLMREAVRDVEAAIERLLRENDRIGDAQRRAAAEAAALGRECETLADDARFAIDRDRQDLAETAIARRIEAAGRMDALATIGAECDAERRRLDAALTDLRARRNALADRATVSMAQDACVGAASGPVPIAVRMDRKATLAEAAFARAREIADMPVSADASAGIAELRRREAVAAELTALSVAAKPRRGKRAKS